MGQHFEEIWPESHVWLLWGSTSPEVQKRCAALAEKAKKTWEFTGEVPVDAQLEILEELER